jgi:hypothetical protein
MPAVGCPEIPHWDLLWAMQWRRLPLQKIG